MGNSQGQNKSGIKVNFEKDIPKDKNLQTFLNILQDRDCVAAILEETKKVSIPESKEPSILFTKKDVVETEPLDEFIFKNKDTEDEPSLPNTVIIHTKMNEGAKKEDIQIKLSGGAKSSKKEDEDNIKDTPDTEDEVPKIIPDKKIIKDSEKEDDEHGTEQDDFRVNGDSDLAKEDDKDSPTNLERTTIHDSSEKPKIKKDSSEKDERINYDLSDTKNIILSGAVSDSDPYVSNKSRVSLLSKESDESVIDSESDHYKPNKVSSVNVLPKYATDS